ncbi:MAG: hypothetical protein FVQ82_08795 [Planctomycetes bacterium]|nr:hypothetical protein [Planctomycetota bacterium]
MSKFGLIIGLVFSAILHAWLFRYGISPVNAVETQQPDAAAPAVAAVDIARIAESQDPPQPRETAIKPPAVKPVEKQTLPPTAEIPELVETGKKQITAQESPGDFAGETDGIADPVVRINWGSLSNAVSILKTSGMKLVIYESSGSVKKQVVIEGVSVSVKPLQIEPAVRYCDSLRIVDNVPAFAAIRTAVKISSADHLAILVPVNIERIIESAKIAEISRRSLSLRDVKVLGGRFNVAGGKVIFIIEKVLLRS